jgi:hypothetical protein
MPESGDKQFKTAATEMWAAYNGGMAELFTERDLYPMDSPERDAVVAKIMALWVSEPDA